MRLQRRIAFVFGLVLSFSLVLPAQTRSITSQDRAVVVAFDPAVADAAGLARGLAQRHGFAVGHVYTTALKGFSARMSSAAVHALQTHSSVRLVEADVAHELATQELPTGIDRIELDEHSGVSLSGETSTLVKVPVAVLDTGVDRDHPDLNVAGGRNFTGGNPEGWDDSNGHGTHVAGTIGAMGNDSHVVGVAPGAPIYAYKVCRNSCFNSDIAAAIDHVAVLKTMSNNGEAGGVDFAAVNMSITSADTTSRCNASGIGATVAHTAICGLRKTGVVFAMAAGNDARKKDAYPEAFTVAAIADFDGRGGGTSAQTCRTDEDDTLANFSNWNVDIAAPGACILSTWLDGTTHTISGTSMATPHVAGAVALYVHFNGSATTEDGVIAIESALLADALVPVADNSTNCSYQNERSTEPLLYVDGTSFESTSSDCELGPADDGGDEPVNDSPVASFTYTCSGALTCSFDASDSSDDGTITKYEWAFGDDSTGSGVTTARTYLTRGNYMVVLTVTDDGGKTDTESKRIRAR